MSKDTATKTVESPKEPGTAVMTWKEKMAMVTAQAAAMEAPKGGFLSFKGGNMSYDDNLISGNKMSVVVVDFVLENVWYAEKYNPAKLSSPACYAFGRDENDLKPHPEAPRPQHTQCGIPGTDNCCPLNEWGSDPEGGKGKACKNSRRIAIMDADSLSRGVEGIKKAGVIMCSIPSTSLKPFSTYVNQCVKVLEKPPFMMVTELSTKPHPTYLYQVHWKVLDQTFGDDMGEALYNKHISVEKQMFNPYPSADEAPAATKPGKF